MIYSDDTRLIYHKKEGQRIKGQYEEERGIVWNGRDKDGKRVGSGVYFLRLRAGELIETTKFVMINN